MSFSSRGLQSSGWGKRGSILWSLYADLSRELTNDERKAVSAALEDIVPGSGRVGRQKGTIEEVSFELEAPSAADAKEAGARYINAVLAKANVKAEYEISLQAARGN